MIERWDKGRLILDGYIARRELRKKGVVISEDINEYKRFRRLARKVIPTVWPELRKNGELACLYLFSQSEQTGERESHDGYAFRSLDTITGRGICSVGLSIEALKAGEDYAALVLLHELAHVLFWEPGEGHGAEYHRTLDGMIDCYNRQTGSSIKNDYFGLESSEAVHRVPTRRYDNLECPTLQRWENAIQGDSGGREAIICKMGGENVTTKKNSRSTTKGKVTRYRTPADCEKALMPDRRLPSEKARQRMIKRYEKQGRG